MKKGLFLFLFGLFSAYLFAQSSIDKLRKELTQAKTDTTKARFMGKLAWELKFSSREEASDLTDEVIRIGTKYNQPQLLAEAWRVKGFLQVISGNSVEAFDLYQKAKGYAQKAGNLQIEASCLSLIAGMYQDKGDYDQSLHYYIQGLQVAEKSGNSRMIAILSNNTAAVYSDAGRAPELSLHYFDIALNHVIPDSNWSFAGLICANMASEYLRAGNMNLAESYLNKALEFVEKPGVVPYDYAITWYEAGNLYMKTGNWLKAESYLLVSLRILDSLQMPDNLLRPLSALAKLYTELNQLEKANSYATRLLEDAKKQKAKLFIRDGYKVLAGIARKRKQYEQALVLQEYYLQWNDSVFNEAKERGISNIQTQALLKQKELETKMNVTYEHRENEILKTSNSRLKRDSIIAISGCILLLISVFLLYRALASKKKQNKELEDQKLIIQNQSIEKDTLIKEIHHRVKNNLQIVSSLLSLQANSLTDEKALSALKESHNRVKTISLIHQKLYAFNDLSTILLEDYIQQLWNHLRTVYNVPHIELKTFVNPKGLLLDMESSIPVGLILNELVTNSIKYAFSDNNTKPVITISFEDNGNGDYTLTVSDNGQGMPQDFDPATSTGLGFRILMELTRQLRGKTWFTNQPSSTFTLVFPKIETRKKAATS